MNIFNVAQGLGQRLITTVVGLMVAVVVIHLLMTFWKSRNVLAVLSVLLLGGAALWGMNNVNEIKNLIGATISSVTGG